MPAQSVVFHLQGEHDQQSHAGGRGRLDKARLNEIYSGGLAVTLPSGTVETFTIDADVYDPEDASIAARRGDQFMIQGNIVNDAGRVAGSFTRVIEQDGSVRNVNLAMDERFQGLGIGSAFLDQTEDALVESGATRFKVQAAGEVGRMAWASRGYRIDPEDDVESITSRWLDDMSANGIRARWPEGDERHAKFDALRRSWESGDDVYPGDLLVIDRDFRGTLISGPSWYGIKDVPGKEELAVEVFHLQGQHNQKDHGNRTGRPIEDLVGGSDGYSPKHQGYFGEITFGRYHGTEDTGVYSVTVQEHGTSSGWENDKYDVEITTDEDGNMIAAEVTRRVTRNDIGDPEMAADDLNTLFEEYGVALEWGEAVVDGRRVPTAAEAAQAARDDAYGDDVAAAYDAVYDAYNFSITDREGQEYFVSADPTVDDPGGGNANGIITDWEGNTVGRFDRNVDLEFGRVDNDSFQIEPAWQGRGIGTAFLDRSEAALAEAGVERSRLTAVDVGRYAWMARGYQVSLTDRESVVRQWVPEVESILASREFTDVQRSQAQAVMRSWQAGDDVYGADLLSVSDEFADVFLNGPTYTASRELTPSPRARAWVDPNQLEFDLSVQVFHLQGQHDQKDHGRRGGSGADALRPRAGVYQDDYGVLDIRSTGVDRIRQMVYEYEGGSDVFDVVIVENDDGTVAVDVENLYGSDGTVEGEQALEDYLSENGIDDVRWDGERGMLHASHRAAIAADDASPRQALVGKVEDVYSGTFSASGIDYEIGDVNVVSRDNMTPVSAEVSGSILVDGEEVGTFHRAVYEDGTVYNHSLNIDPTMQGFGIGTAFLDKTEADLQPEVIKMAAVNVGKYAWAARGYKLDVDSGSSLAAATRDQWIFEARKALSNTPEWRANDFTTIDKLAALERAWMDDLNSVYPGDLLAIDPRLKDVLLEGPSWDAIKRRDDPLAAAAGTETFHLQGQHDQQSHAGGRAKASAGIPEPSAEELEWRRSTREVPFLPNPAAGFESKRAVFRNDRWLLVHAEDGTALRIEGGTRTGTQDRLDMVNALADAYDANPVKALDKWGEPVEPRITILGEDEWDQGPTVAAFVAPGLDPAKYDIHSNMWGPGMTGKDPYRIYVNDNVDIWNDEALGQFRRDAMPEIANHSPRKYIITHEYGHTRMALGDDNRDEVKRIGGAVKNRGWMGMSEYGRSNQAESHAEAFTEWTLSGGQTSNQAARLYARDLRWPGAPAFSERIEDPIAASAGIDEFMREPVICGDSLEGPVLTFSDGQVEQLAVQVFHLQGEHDQQSHAGEGAVVDIRSHPEADVFLEDEEWDYVYTKRKLTLRDFDQINRVSAEDERLPDGRTRSENVADWMQSEGGPLAATAQSPILAFDRGGRLELVDGWHRLKEADGPVWAYVGAVPSDDLAVQVFHLQGEHDQQSHAGGRGGEAPTTPTVEEFDAAYDASDPIPVYERMGIDQTIMRLADFGESGATDPALRRDRRVDEEAASWAHATYTLGGSEAMNKYLRGQELPVHFQDEHADNAEILKEAIAEAEPTKHDLVVYRGLGRFPRGMEGDRIQDNGFISTSLDRRVAETFGNVVEIRVPAGTRAIAGNWGEFEVILAPGTQFDVTEDGLDVV